MKEAKQNLTLDRPATYQIKVPGHLEERWWDWGWTMTIVYEGEENEPLVTTLTGTFDQAALQGLLRWLYSLGLPLISVQCIGAGRDETA